MAEELKHITEPLLRFILTNNKKKKVKHRL